MESGDRNQQTADALAADVRATLAAAERVAEAIKAEARERAGVRAREAELEAKRIVAAAREEADALVEQRRLEIADLSDAVVRNTELILDRLGAAQDAERLLDNALSALGEAAELLPRALAPAGSPTAAPEGESTVASEGDRSVTSYPSEPYQGSGRRSSSERLRRRRVAGGQWRASEFLGEVSQPARRAQEGPDSPAADEIGSPMVQEQSRERTAEEPRRDMGGGEAGADSAADDQGPLSSARLLALHLAVNGTSRADAGEEITRALGVAEPGAIVDEVFEAYEARR